MATRSKFITSVTPKADFTRPVDMTGLRGQSVFITGGASGLGAGFAAALAEAGCCVTIADLNEEGGKAICEEMAAKDLKLNFAKTDVTSYPSQLAAFKSALAFSPNASIDIVIPCAGLMGQVIVNHLPPLDSSRGHDPPAPPTSIFDVNLQGVYYTTYLALHYFRTNPNPAITKQLLFLSSVLAYIEAPLVIDYNASKHAVRGLWRSIRGEGKGLGIQGSFRTNIIAPNLVNTPMTKGFLEFLRDDRGFAVAEVEDLVDITMKVLSDEGINGRAIAVFSDKTAVDLCDDFEGADGGREALNLIESGLLGPGPTRDGKFRMID